MSKNIAQSMLLTGAGFTKDFGGFIGEGMWALIFNHQLIHKNKALKDLMLKEYNYESIYNKILDLSNNYTVDEKEAIKKAVFDAYEKLDVNILGFNKNHDKYDLNEVNNFINLFANNNRQEINYFFTLNQDIFIERFYHLTNGKPLKLPGVEQKPSPGSLSEREQSYCPSKFNITVPDQNAVKNISLNSIEFNYIKLHGSFNWKRSDSSDIMVIGGNKEEQINKEPLLKRYFEFFKHALSQDERRLLIIGYSFGDEHINTIIADSVKNYGLKLFVISPEGPKKFIGRLKRLKKEKLGDGNTLRKGLSGYFPYNFKEILSESSLPNKMIVRRIFPN